MITPHQLLEKHTHELNLNELSFIHLSDSISFFTLKENHVRSTLSFAIQNVRQALNLEYSKQIMPYMTLCAILDQIGICYDRNDKPLPKFTNGLKRALVQFGEIDEDDDLINIIYSLRNGLLHNISLTSFDKKNGKFYRFRYNSEITSIYKEAEGNWNGSYETLDTDPAKFTTNINAKLFSDLVFSCIDKANSLNRTNNLILRLEGGLMQLFFDYILSIYKEK
ncbi:hypothetical protein [Chryseobacterium artocarpi]|uniref:hypothetical protein n=1 Tax=Chryseobacterium artocarpi TaxID=1414727 RepID=UPI003F3D0A87